MTPVIRVQPALEPITLQEAKEHLKVTGSYQNDEITRMIKAARGVVERYLNRALITQEWDVYFDHWCDELKLHFPPLQSVDAVKYFNQEGTEATLSPTLYWVTKSDPSCIVRKYSATWPELEEGRPDAIKIEITCGYGDNPTDVPEDIRNAIKVVLTDLYENRGTVVLGSVQKIPNYLNDLIHTYKIYLF